LESWIPNEFRTLFPVPPATPDLDWALTTAKGLTELRNSLGEAGLAVADAATLLAGNLEEEDRWLELARLERRYEHSVEAHRILDLLAVRKSQALTPAIPTGRHRDPVGWLPGSLPWQWISWAPSAVATR